MHHHPVGRALGDRIRQIALSPRLAFRSRPILVGVERRDTPPADQALARKGCGSLDIGDGRWPTSRGGAADQHRRNDRRRREPAKGSGTGQKNSGRHERTDAFAAAVVTVHSHSRDRCFRRHILLLLSRSRTHVGSTAAEGPSRGSCPRSAPQEDYGSILSALIASPLNRLLVLSGAMDFMQVHTIMLDNLRRMLGNFGQVRPVPLPQAQAADRSHETQYMTGRLRDASR